MCMCVGHQYGSGSDGLFRKPSEGQSLISYLSEQDFGSCADLEKVSMFVSATLPCVFQWLHVPFRLCVSPLAVPQECVSLVCASPLTVCLVSPSAARLPSAACLAVGLNLSRRPHTSLGSPFAVRATQPRLISSCRRTHTSASLNL